MLGIEQEYRYLVKLPSADSLSRLGAPYRIEQIYLTPKEGVDSRRIRKRVKNGIAEYFYTEKTALSYGKNLESEQKISEAEYQNYRTQQYGNTIEKCRYVFPFNGLTFELDVYSFAKHTAVLEVETDLPEEKVPFPPQLTLIRPITGEKQYSNAALSQTIPEDFI